MRKSAYDLMSPRIEKYLSEKDRPQTVKEIAEGLGVVTSSVYNVLQLMEVFNVVQMVKRMGRQRYFLKGVYDDEQLSAMFPPKIFALKPKRRKSSTQSQRKARLSADERFLEDHLSTMRMQASSGAGPSALAMIGLTQQVMADEDILIEELPRALEVKIEVAEKKPETPKKIEPFGSVKNLPKDFIRLTRGDMKYLKEQLKGLDEYEGIERFKTVFSKLSALENKRYGNTLYLSMGTNPWDNIHKVTVDSSMSELMVLPAIDVKRWFSWNDFLIGLKKPKIKYSKEEYDKIIDDFMESGHRLVEMTVENRKANYVKYMLNKRIGERGLEDQVKASHVAEWIYLEKFE